MKIKIIKFLFWNWCIGFILLTIVFTKKSNEIYPLGLISDIKHGFFGMLFYFFVQPFLLILMAIEFALNLIILNFHEIILNNLKNNKTFFFLVIIFGAISLVYVILRLYQLKFSSLNSFDITQKRQNTIYNFFSSFIIMIIFPFAFFTLFSLILEIQKIFLSFQNSENNLNFLIMKIFNLGFINKNSENIAKIERFFSDQQKSNDIYSSFINTLDFALNERLITWGIYSLTFGLLGAIAGILVIGQITYYLFKGVFTLMMLFMYSPIPIFKRSADNSLSFKKWKDSLSKNIQISIAITFLLMFTKFVLNFLATNKLQLPYVLAGIFNLIGLVFLIFIVREFYEKIMLYLGFEVAAVNSNFKSRAINIMKRFSKKRK